MVHIRDQLVFHQEVLRSQDQPVCRREVDMVDNYSLEGVHCLSWPTTVHQLRFLY